MTTPETQPQPEDKPETGTPTKKAPLPMSELCARLKELGLLLEGPSKISGPLAIIGAPVPPGTGPLKSPRAD